MLLETQLDSALDSTRSEIRFMREYLDYFRGVTLIAKEVHSRADLEKFLDFVRVRRFGTIHIVSHGEAQWRESNIILTRNEPVNLRRRENIGLFRDLKAEALFFSCCWMGSDRELMREIMDASKVSAVFSYSHLVDDHQAFLIEALYYHLAYGGKPEMPFEEIEARLQFVLEYMRIDRDPSALFDPLLVATCRRH